MLTNWDPLVWFYQHSSSSIPSGYGAKRNCCVSMFEKYTSLVRLRTQEWILVRLTELHSWPWMYMTHLYAMIEKMTIYFDCWAVLRSLHVESDQLITSWIIREGTRFWSSWPNYPGHACIHLQNYPLVSMDWENCNRPWLVGRFEVATCGMGSFDHLVKHWWRVDLGRADGTTLAMHV